jgi:hypothetical protein
LILSHAHTHRGREKEREPDNINTREATTAEELFSTLSRDMLNAKLVIT